jgi:hypothetical protein
LQMPTSTYAKDCNTQRLSEAIKRRFPDFSGVVSSDSGKTTISVTQGISDSDEPVLDYVVERHIANASQGREKYDEASQIADLEKRQDAQLFVIARSLDLADV